MLDRRSLRVHAVSPKIRRIHQTSPVFSLLRQQGQCRSSHSVSADHPPAGGRDRPLHKQLRATTTSREAEHKKLVGTEFELKEKWFLCSSRTMTGYDERATHSIRKENSPDYGHTCYSLPKGTQIEIKEVIIDPYKKDISN